jgi:ABC-type microcin C transport system permease subunit YejB
MLRGLAVYGTLGPDEIEAKPGRNVVRQAKIRFRFDRSHHRRLRLSLKSYRQFRFGVKESATHH